jgi:hypothetical protein
MPGSVRHPCLTWSRRFQPGGTHTRIIKALRIFLPSWLRKTAKPAARRKKHTHHQSAQDFPDAMVAQDSKAGRQGCMTPHRIQQPPSAIHPFHALK